jgi:hypothetical protein
LFARSVALRRDKVESFEQYPFYLPVVKTLDRIDLHPKVTFFVGLPIQTRMQAAMLQRTHTAIMKSSGIRLIAAESRFNVASNVRRL